jgi:hypothetical protein
MQRMTWIRGALLAAAVAAVGCQTYDFEPVKPLAVAQTVQSKTVAAHNLKPNIMLLIDKSGSMNQAIDGTAATCNGCTSNCPGTCPTRISVLKSTMDTFLGMNGKIGRFGATYFPADNQCTPSSSGTVLSHISPASDSDADLQSWASKVNMAIQDPNFKASGGTPTNASLEFLGSLTELHDKSRDNFVLLLTDGVPNCNINNPVDCTNSACVGTLGGSPPTMKTTNDTNFCIRGCLDQDGTVQAIKDLGAANIRTIVVGFGSDFATPVALATLNAMARAGGFARLCPNNDPATECGDSASTPNACVMGVCQNAFYAAANGTDLAKALQAISAILGADTICKYTLQSQPTSDQLISVIINGVAQPSGPDTWAFMGGQIVMQGMLCSELQNSTLQNPVTVEIRVVQSL